MDWIEQIFGFSPDLGNGTAELSISTAIVVVAYVLARRAHRNSQGGKLRDEA
jgi:hypothetical protein